MKDWDKEIEKCKTREDVLKLRQELFAAREALLKIDMQVVQPLAIKRVMERAAAEGIAEVTFDEGLQMMMQATKEIILEMYGVEQDNPTEADIQWMKQMMMGMVGNN